MNFSLTILSFHSGELFFFHLLMIIIWVKSTLTIKKKTTKTNKILMQIYTCGQNQHESMDQRPHPVTPWNEQGHGSYESYQSVASSGNQEDLFKSLSNSFLAD